MVRGHAGLRGRSDRLQGGPGHPADGPVRWGGGSASTQDNPMSGGGGAPTHIAIEKPADGTMAAAGTGIYGNLSDWNDSTSTGAVMKINGKEIRCGFRNLPTPSDCAGASSVSMCACGVWCTVRASECAR